MILDLNLEEMTTFLVDEIGLKAFKARMVFEWIHQKAILDYDQMTSLHQSERELLKEKVPFPAWTITEHPTKDSAKFTAATEDGSCIEFVTLKSKADPTLCISSQVGCALKCAFCETGTLGVQRNLTTDEIVYQVLLAEKKTGGIGNIVLMGMGEPLLNFDNVLKAISILHEPTGMNVSPRRITLSTAGIVPGIDKLLAADPGINLAISLNAPTDELRSEIMPINKTYNINQLVRAAKNYQEKSGRRVTVEYVLMKDVNDTPVLIRSLIALIRRTGFHLNLIPYNPTSSNFKKPTVDHIDWIKAQLEAAHINVTVRNSRGVSTNAACGMLAAKKA
jgi:23S rRNA (adenine2503-C2)-methyltransferase